TGTFACLASRASESVDLRHGKIRPIRVVFSGTDRLRLYPPRCTRKVNTPLGGANTRRQKKYNKPRTPASTINQFLSTNQFPKKPEVTVKEIGRVTSAGRSEDRLDLVKTSRPS